MILDKNVIYEKLKGNYKRVVGRFNNLLNDFIKKHGDKYNYSLVEYKNMITKIKIICPIHGEFKQTPDMHLKTGCKKCGTQRASEKRRKTIFQFLKDVYKIHGDKYNYSLVEYINDSSKIKIICKEHGIFTQNVSNHLQGQGCPNCRIEHIFHGKEYYKCKPTTLYYIKIEKEGFPPVWKIGITIHSVKKRFNDDIRYGCNITVLKEELFKDGQYAWLKEQLILKSLNEYQYKGKSLLIGGNTELFSEDCYLIK